MTTQQSTSVRRFAKNPILTEADIPWDCTSVFNAGVCKWENRYAMLFRTDTGEPADPDAHLTRVGLAWSEDGYAWEVAPDPIFDQVILKAWLRDAYPERLTDNEVIRIYDPRITVIDDEVYFCFALDTVHGVRGGLAKSTDFRNWKLLNISLPENRNMVLFPERVNGKLMRLERPFPMYLRGNQESFDIWCSDSVDGEYWGKHRLLIGAEEVPFSNCKIGPGAPPIRTDKGWLVAFHAVYQHDDHDLKTWSATPWRKEYLAGLMLLDIDDPSQVIGMAHEPLLAAEADYELDGFRGSVIFPGGFVAESDGTVKIYYGAADTVVTLAESTIQALLELIEPL